MTRGFTLVRQCRMNIHSAQYLGEEPQDLSFRNSCNFWFLINRLTLTNLMKLHNSTDIKNNYCLNLYILWAFLAINNHCQTYQSIVVFPILKWNFTTIVLNIFLAKQKMLQLYRVICSNEMVSHKWAIGLVIVGECVFSSF